MSTFDLRAWAESIRDDARAALGSTESEHRQRLLAGAEHRALAALAALRNVERAGAAGYARDLIDEARSMLDSRWPIDSATVPADYPPGPVLMSREFWATSPHRHRMLTGEPAHVCRDDRNGGGTVLVLVELADG